MRVHSEVVMTIVMCDCEGTKKTLCIPFVITDYLAEIFCDGVGVLLGLPWLQQVNPDIDWVEKSWRFRIERDRIAFIQSRKQVRKVMRECKATLIV